MQNTERSNLNKSTGWYETQNGQYCENCGYKRKTKPTIKRIWNYGVPCMETHNLCKQCEGM
jgi:hypothetical protein